MSTIRTGPIIIASGHPLEGLGMQAVLESGYRFNRVPLVTSYDELLRLAPGESALIVVDAALPGFQPPHVQALRAVNRAARLAIVTATCDIQLVFSLVALGAHGVIAKNLPPAQLMAAFGIIMSGHIYVPPEICASCPPPAAPGGGPETEPLHLSRRQKEVLDLACEGRSNKEIARRLLISEATVKVHISAAFRSLGVHNRTRAVAAYLDAGDRAA